jgi:hypothetical protein
LKKSYFCKKVFNFFLKILKKKCKARALARAQARAGERASQSWPKLAQNNPI